MSSKKIARQNQCYKKEFYHTIVMKSRLKTQDQVNEVEMHAIVKDLTHLLRVVGRIANVTIVINRT